MNPIKAFQLEERWQIKSNFSDFKSERPLPVSETSHEKIPFHDYRAALVSRTESHARQYIGQIEGEKSSHPSSFLHIHKVDEELQEFSQSRDVSHSHVRLTTHRMHSFMPSSSLCRALHSREEEESMLRINWMKFIFSHEMMKTSHFHFSAS